MRAGISQSVQCVHRGLAGGFGLSSAFCWIASRGLATKRTVWLQIYMLFLNWRFAKLLEIYDSIPTNGG